MSLTEDIDLKDLVRTIPDYPKPGIMFRDITTLLGHANGLRACIERLVAPFTNRRIEVGCRHRGARLHPRRRCRRSPALRLRADPQEGQAAGEGHRPGVRAGIRHRYHRDPRGCAESQASRCCLSTTSSPPAARRTAAVKLLRKLECRSSWRRLRHRSAGTWRLTRLAKLGVECHTLMAFEGD